MHWLTDAGYAPGRLIFQRGLAVTYLIAFAVAANQFRALLGRDGLTPIPEYLRRVRFRSAPSVFHLHYSDRFFAAVAWAGALLAAAVAFGLADAVPLGVSMALWALLWAAYLSIVNVGQTWYGFGWESLLLEAGFLAVFLGNARTAPPVLVLWLLRWLLFRLEFGAGLIKIRGDRCWRDLTCLYYHHETQPMPNPLSRRFHHLPRPLHRVEVAANHVTQLIVPFGLFAPQPYATVAAAIVVITQLWLILSGNFAWLNWLTALLAVPVIDWRAFGLGPGATGAPRWHEALVVAVTVLVAALSYWPVRNLISRRQRMNASFNAFHLVNTYGAFGTVGRRRYEVVVEGTEDPDPGPGTEWREYEFKGKPGDVTRRPPQIAPYHLRLDWMMWFAGISVAYADPWFARFVWRLLENDGPTLRLLRHNPFPAEPPAYVRARLFHYRFTTREEHRLTGAWWHREPIMEYCPPIGRESRAGGQEAAR